MKEMKSLTGFDRITFDPRMMGGRACVRGLRIPVSLILKLVASGMTAEAILEEYPDLQSQDIAQCLDYAAWLASEENLPAPNPPPTRVAPAAFAPDPRPVSPVR